MVRNITPKGQSNVGSATPPPSYEQKDDIKIKRKTFSDRAKQITLGNRFVSATMANPSHVSYISVYPRKSIHSVHENIIID